jgi:hypothetical protein
MKMGGLPPPLKIKGGMEGDLCLRMRRPGELKARLSASERGVRNVRL